MKKLIHNELENLAVLLTALNGLHELYNEKDSQFFIQTNQILDRFVQHFGQTNQIEKENRSKCLISDLSSCKRGYHPYSYEKITTHKREMQLIIGFQILKGMEDLVLDDYYKQKSKLEESKPLIQNMVLAAFQLGIMNDQNLSVEFTQNYLEQLWKTIGGDENLALVQKKIIASTSFYDAIILFSQMLHGLRAV